jgi:hypothetical protein
MHCREGTAIPGELGALGRFMAQADADVGATVS